MWLRDSRVMGPSTIVGVIALVAIEFALNGGQLTGAPAPDPSFRIRLERGPCLGDCPNYTVDIDADGQVTFVGRPSAIPPSAPCQGTRRWRIAPQTVASLEAQVDRSDVFALRDAYQARITDQPRYGVTVTRRGKTKVISDYVGAMVGMPRRVTDLENAVDIAANTRACVEPAKSPI